MTPNKTVFIIVTDWLVTAVNNLSINRTRQADMKRGNITENRRSEIVRIGAKLFSQKGYHGTTLDEIARELGITKAALYRYVKGKGEIIKEISKKNVMRMQQSVNISKLDLSPKEKLHLLIKYHVAFSAESADEANILFGQTSALPKRSRETVNHWKKKVELALQQILDEGNKQGYFAIDDIQITSFAILGLCNWTYNWYSPEGRLTPEEISNKLIDFIENAVSSRK